MDSTAISHVRTTFKALAAAEDGGVQVTRTFYSILFARYPQMRDIFPAVMEMQADRLLEAIGYVVDKLDEPDLVRGFLTQLGRDHRRYGIAEEHFYAVGGTLLSTLERFAGTELWTDEVEDAWREAIALIAATMIEALNEGGEPATWTGTVVEHKQVLQDVAVIRLQLNQPMHYGAGQYVGVSVPGRPRMWRYLSPAIPANEAGQIEFHVRRVAGGWVSASMVRETRPGDVWQLSAPLGGLGVDRSRGRDMLMIGSGTGIAPLRAQVMEMAMRGRNPRVHLFAGGTYPCDLYDLDILWQLARTNPWLTVIPVSAEDVNPWWHTDPEPVTPPGMQARLTGKLGEVVAEFGAWEDRDIQIVGSPSTVQTVKYRLQAKGTPMENIRHDPLT
ncbi:FAD-binding oxidoreductase [Rhodococcus sp. NPDC058505]|uniref:FAD-binding oxidoreductase n=1 Tax=unclassified Rhodococcus (in: high G+C Gram-positive bacteria) TaxID=192944 RepID=UPI0036532FA4